MTILTFPAHVIVDDLQPGDVVTAWCDYTAPPRTVEAVHPATRILVRWTDGTQDVFRRGTAFRRVDR